MKHSAAGTTLKKELDRIRTKIERAEFIAADPVQFPRRYTKRADVEIAAFLAAAIAWGRRDLILRSAERMFARMGKSPAAFVMADVREPTTCCIHRTFFEKDLLYFCRGFRACYAKYGSLEKLFARGMADGGSIWEGIALFREEMAAANGGCYTKHIANPDSSACKRINLALRWLVRPGPVDIGLWKKIPAAALYIPLDVHVARTARKLGLLNRKSNDKKAVIELTGKLRKFCPDDPVQYDFALFGTGSRPQK
ncbi:MAG: TIGR02757 family protein [Treponema sp.]|nr:TIGR02757 family protein [Treponema sp.]